MIVLSIVRGVGLNGAKSQNTDNRARWAAASIENTLLIGLFQTVTAYGAVAFVC